MTEIKIETKLTSLLSNKIYKAALDVLFTFGI